VRHEREGVEPIVQLAGHLPSGTISACATTSPRLPACKARTRSPRRDQSLCPAPPHGWWSPRPAPRPRPWRLLTPGCPPRRATATRGSPGRRLLARGGRSLWA